MTPTTGIGGRTRSFWSGRWKRRLVLAMAIPAALLGVTPTASGHPTASTAGTATAPPAFTATKTIARTHLDSNGATVVDDQRTFSVSVSQTSQLRDRQVIELSWTGAHPSGGLIADEQGYLADLAEFPVVIMECRGVDSASASTGQQVAPSTCWTATPDERTQTNSGGVPLWSLDYYATPGQRQPLAGQPATPPAACSGVAVQEGYWVPFVAADGTDYPVGPYGCGGEPAGMSQTSSGSAADVLPSDTTYAATNLQGDGSTKFSVETAVSNSELGCSETVACTLEIIPIEGLSCDPGAALAAQPPETLVVKQCESPGAWPAGSLNNGGFTNLNGMSLAVQGSLWFLPSNWRNRVAVPMTFAPSPDVCSSANSSAPIPIYGSELVDSATSQWNPHFCLSPTGFNVTHVQTAEPEAKNLLADGSIEAAVQALPPPTPFPRPTVQAPVALGGFAIAYVIDNGDGTPYRSLKLDARLLAKLLTESYPADPRIADVTGDAAIAKNPLTIFDDPEFKALNPDLHITDHVPIGEQPAGAGSLYSILGQTDVVYALTSYINADPEARSWLNGQADPWGTVVNPAYKRISLPVDSWQELDTVHTGPIYTGGAGIQNDCLAYATDPPAARPLLDAPVSTLGQVAFNLQFGISPSLDSCTWTGTGQVRDPATGRLENTGVADYHQIGIEAVGARFLIGLVPLALADEYDLDTAALESNRSPTAQGRFTNSTGRTFASPDNASLRAAASLFSPDTSVGSWTFPYSDFPSKPAASGAYPGAMLLSMDVPTTGLPSSEAAPLGTYMAYVGGAGQAPGAATGELPAGYLPLTAANGLGNEAAYTVAAASDVRAQNGQVPALIPGGIPPKATTTTPTTTTTRTNPWTAPAGNFSPPAPTGPFGGLNGSPAPSGSNSSSGSAGSNGSSATGSPGIGGTASRGHVGSVAGRNGQAVALVGDTAAIPAGIGAVALPLAMVVVVLGLALNGSWRLPRRKRRSARPL